MLRSLLGRLRSWWAVENADERIQSSGEVYLDPAYNGHYTGEQRLQQFSQLDDDRDEARVEQRQ